MGDEAIVEHQRRFRREPGGGLHRRHGGDQAAAEARGGERQAQEQGPHPGGFAGGEPRMNRSIGNFAAPTFLAPSINLFFGGLQWLRSSSPMCLIPDFHAIIILGANKLCSCISIIRVPLIRLVFGVAWCKNLMSCLCFPLGPYGGFFISD